MKTTTLSIFCVLISACGSSKVPEVPVPTPVDMEYNVSVEMLEDNCADSAIPTGLTVTLDVALQTDGSMAVEYPIGFVPGYGYDKGLVINDDYTEGMLLTESGDPDISVTGSLTMESADLVFAGQRLLLQEDGSEVLCAGNTKVRLSGAARPFWDVPAFDGKYEAYYDFYGQVCPPAQQPPVPISWTVPLDIKDLGGSALFVFDSHDEILAFVMPTEILASGQVNWEGEMYLAVLPYDLYELEGSVVGDFADGKYSIRMEFHAVGDSTGCNFILEAAGTKRAPDQMSISNVYRMAFSKLDTCQLDANGNPTTEAFEQEGDVALRTNGQLTLMYGIERFNLDPQTDGTYTRHAMGGGLTLDHAASVIPPNLSFSYVWSEPTQNGTCYITHDVVGVPRYFPDLALDSLKEMSDTKPRMTRPAPSPVSLHGVNSTERSEPKSFGLATMLKEHAHLRPLSEAPQFVRESIQAR